MYKKDVVQHFGTTVKVAKALQLDQSAITQWRAIIPELQAFRLERITNGKLVYNSELYPRSKASLCVTKSA